MKKYLIGASVPIILYVLYVFVSPIWLEYRYSLRERIYTEDMLYSKATQLPVPCEKVQAYLKDKKSTRLLYTPNEWMSYINLLSLVSTINQPLTKDDHKGSHWRFFLETKFVKKVHLRVWNKRADAKDLLCETISDLTIGSFVIDKDTFWIPVAQKTYAKKLTGVVWNAQGFSVENVLKFYASIQDDGSLETNLSLVQNFSAMRNYRFNARFEDGSFSSMSTADISYKLMSFKIVSKNNKYEIVQDGGHKEDMKENKHFFSEEDAKRIGLKNLGLAMYGVGTIEIEVVK